MDYARLYDYRHRGTDQAARAAVWRPIAAHVHRAMGRPATVLDPAAGRAEFINAVPAAERWAVDAQPSLEQDADPQVKCLVGDVFDVALPDRYFDGVFVSNFLEHLPSPDAVQDFLARMRQAAAPGGRLAVLGPNFRYTAKVYYDFADHTLALTHNAVAEHLHAAGFAVAEVTPRFLPYSFSGLLPPSPTLTAAYLRLRPAWPVLGRQFLVLARAPH